MMAESNRTARVSLVGRELEVKLLADLVSGVRNRGGALFFYGDAGIGKSALLGYAGGLAQEAGLRVLRAAGALD